MNVVSVLRRSLRRSKKEGKRKKKVVAENADMEIPEDLVVDQVPSKTDKKPKRESKIKRLFGKRDKGGLFSSVVEKFLSI